MSFVLKTKADGLYLAAHRGALRLSADATGAMQFHTQADAEALADTLKNVVPHANFGFEVEHAVDSFLLKDFGGGKLAPSEFGIPDRAMLELLEVVEDENLIISDAHACTTEDPIPRYVFNAVDTLIGVNQRRLGEGTESWEGCYSIDTTLALLWARVCPDDGQVDVYVCLELANRPMGVQR